MSLMLVVHSHALSYQTQVRVLWYLAEIIAQEPGYDGGGFVMVMWAKNATIWDHSHTCSSKMSYYSHNAWPIKTMPTHVCCASEILRRVVKPVMLALFDRTHRSRCQVHGVEESKIFEVLSRYGLGKEMLPTKMGGMVELNILEWIANRRAIEMEEM